MIISDVDICNNALDKIRGRNITSLTQDKTEAKLCNRIYSVMRDEVLTAHPWSFAIRRVALAESVNTPLFDYDHAYQIPADCLRVLDLDDSYKWVIEDDKLLTDAPYASIKYISRVTDTSKYSTSFVEALTFRMAWEMAYPLSENVSLQQTMMQSYNLILADARSINAQERYGHNVMDDETDIYINSRE